MAYNRGKLFINGEPYAKAIQPAKTSNMLTVNKEESARRRDLFTKLHTKPAKKLNGSSFQAYMCNARSLNEVKKAYAAL